MPFYVLHPDLTGGNKTSKYRLRLQCLCRATPRPPDIRGRLVVQEIPRQSKNNRLFPTDSHDSFRAAVR